MRRSLCTLRKAAVVFIAGLSVGFAIFLVWHLVTPGRIGQVASVELLAVLALFVLPGATAAAWELDRRGCPRDGEMEEDDAELQLPLTKAMGKLHGAGGGRVMQSAHHRRRVGTSPAAAPLRGR